MIIAGHLRALEEQLLQSEFRKNREAVSALLAEEFREFGSSGQIYDKQQVLDLLEGEQQVPISLTDFYFQQLNRDVVLVTYKSRRAEQTALRSSLWMLREGRWQMIFHQGTKAEV
jgi:hypothetical protein